MTFSQQLFHKLLLYNFVARNREEGYYIIFIRFLADYMVVLKILIEK